MKLDDLSQSLTLLTEAEALKFRYSNYQTDPKPEVLVLGKWKPKSTGNNLLAGVNLNYLTDRQEKQLVQAIPAIMKRGDLKSRYRTLANVLPDVAKHYRTYDTGNIHMVQPSEIIAKTKPDKKLGKPGQPDKKAKVSIGPGAKLPQPSDDIEVDVEPTEPDQTEPVEKKPRETWQAKELAKREKLQQAKQKSKPSRPIRREAPRPQPEKIQEPVQPQEPEDKYAVDAMDALDAIDDITHDKPKPDLNRESKFWNNPERYIEWHSMPKYHLSANVRPTKALQNIETGEIILDSVADFSEMIVDAGWEYINTIRYENLGLELIVNYDCDPGEADSHIAKFCNSDEAKCLLFSSR